MSNCSKHKWRTFRAGRAAQVALKAAADVESLSELDRKRWMAMSAPVKGLRFDTRTLELMDSDGDGRIRMEEVVGAIDFLKSKGFDFSKLFERDEADEKALAEVVARQAALGSEPPSEDEAHALAEWEKKGAEPDVAVLGGDTAGAEAALAAVEKEIDAFFAPDGAAALVTEEAVKTLPLKDHINARYLEAIIDFSEKCVKPILGDRAPCSEMYRERPSAGFSPNTVQSRRIVLAPILIDFASKAADVAVLTESSHFSLR